MTYLYLDSLAIVKLVRPERESESLREYLARSEQAGSYALATSTIARIEVFRALQRDAPSLAAGAIEVFSAIRLIGVSEQVLHHATAVPPPTLRTLDALHLATVLSEPEGLLALVTYDLRLAEAARLAGLPVESPGV